MEYINGFIEASRGKKLEPVLEMLVANPALVTRDMIEDVLKFKRIDGVEAALNRIIDATFPGGQQALELAPRLGEVKAPAQVIWGRQDRIIPSAMPRACPGASRCTSSTTPATWRTWRGGRGQPADQGAGRQLTGRPRPPRPVRRPAASHSSEPNLAARAFRPSIR